MILLNYIIIVNIIHIIFIGPLFYYMGKNIKSLSRHTYPLIFAMFAYILYKFKPKFHLKSYYNIVQLSHSFFVAPLLLYILIKKNESHNSIGKLLEITGLIVSSYHSYKLYTRLT